MKLIFIIDNITKAAGTEKATILLANSLIKKNYVVEIISIKSSQGELSFFPLSSQVLVHHLDGKANKLVNLFRINRLLKSRKPNVILGTGHNISFFLPFIRNKKSKIIAVEHIDADTIPQFSRKLIEFSYPKFDAIVVLSEIAKNKMQQISDRVTVISNQITLSDDKSHLIEEKIILVGRFSPEKAYERLVPIASLLKNKYPSWTINIYGEGDVDYKSRICLLFEKENLNNIKVHKATKDIKSKFLESTIFMITSKNEAFPMVILEAKSFGLPIIGFSNEGVNALVNDKEDGFIVEDEIQAFEKLSLLIKDKGLREVFAENGYQNINQFSEEVVSQHWDKLLNSL